MMFLNKYVLAGMAIAVLAGLGFSHKWVYNQGIQNCEADAQAELNKALKKQAELAEELEAARGERQHGQRETVREIYVQPDPSSCDAVDVPDGVFRSLGGGED